MKRLAFCLVMVAVLGMGNISCWAASWSETWKQMSEDKKATFVIGYRSGVADVCSMKNISKDTANMCNIVLNEKATTGRIISLIDILYNSNRYNNININDFIGYVCAWAGELMTTDEMINIMRNLTKFAETEDQDKKRNQQIEAYKETINNLLIK